MNLLTGVRTSNTVFGDVDETVRIENHVFESLERNIFCLCFVSEVRSTVFVRVRMSEPGRLWRQVRGE
jgi:hypothetical protein